MAINGTADHIHIAITIPPSQLVSHVVGQLKAFSSFVMNKSLTEDDRFEWQGGHGVLTFGEKVLPKLLAYIANQKAHHQNNEIWDYLETLE